MSSLNPLNIIKNAEGLRYRLGLDFNGPLDIFSVVADSQDITLVFYPLQKKFSGLCMRDSENKFVVVNSNHSEGRQRFTAAHELCHLFYHKNFPKIICSLSSEKTDLIEKEADMFASFFLMPNMSLKKFFKEKLGKDFCYDLNTSDLVRIEQHFKMSRMAILYRLVEYENCISWAFANELKSGVKSQAISMGYDANLYEPTRDNKKYFSLGKYVRVVENAKSKDKLTESKYESLLLDGFRSDIVYNLNEDEEFYD
jgi:Zn-dependent peptidase ImmA (M78 family)